MKKVQKAGLRIGVMVYDFEPEYSLELIRGVSDFCREHETECMVFLTRSKNRIYTVYDNQAYTITQLMNRQNIDGLVIISTTQCMYIAKEEFEKELSIFENIPTASIGVKLDSVISVIVDCKKAFADVVQHVITVHGRRKIMLLASTSSAPDIVEREQAYREVLAENGIPVNESLILYPTFDLKLLEKQLSRYHSRSDLDFDAVVSIDDKMAIGCIEYLSKIGVHVPDDVVVTGFDDTNSAMMFLPSLSSVNQQLHRQGYEAASSVYGCITGRKEEKLKILPAVPVYRQSCGCISSSDKKNPAITDDGSVKTTAERDLLSVETEYLHIRDQLSCFQYFIQEMQSNMTIAEFRKHLNHYLRQFNISQCAICLFSRPVVNTAETDIIIPDSASLFLGYDDTAQWHDDSGTVTFNPYEELIPDRLFPRGHSMKTVMSLFCKTTIYGYVCFAAERSDLEMYHIIFTAVANSLGAVLSISMKEKETELLKNQKTTLEKYTNSLETMSTTDELTKVLNRRGLLQYGKQTFDTAMEMKQKGLVIFGDMDGLKKINDTYGHDAGNRAILAEVFILKRTFRSTDIIARVGGDEFVIIAAGMTMSRFEIVKTSIAETADEWNRSSGEPFTVSISMGAAPFSSDNCDLDHLINAADSAQYEEKRRKKAERKS